MTDSPVLTTSRAARCLRVAPRTVAKWFDRGIIRGAYREPETNNRLIPLSALRAFMAEHGLDPSGLPG